MRTTPRVLLVEDDEAIQADVSEALSEAGYEVIVAPDGATALHLIEQGPQQPHLILLDVVMPIMDGWVFARAYHQMPGNHAPIIVLTAAGGVDAARCAEQIDARAVLVKPFDIGALLAIVDRYTQPSQRPHPERRRTLATTVG